MAVPYFLEGVLGGSPEDLPPGRAQARDRHLKFHEDWDNLPVISDWEYGGIEYGGLPVKVGFYCCAIYFVPQRVVVASMS